MKIRVFGLGKAANTLCVFAVSAFLLTGCGPQTEDKMTFEEAGYYDEIAYLVRTIGWVGHITEYKNPVSDVLPGTRMQARYLSSIDRIHPLNWNGLDWVATKKALGGIQPPDGMESLHHKLQEVIDQQIVIINDGHPVALTDYPERDPIPSDLAAMMRLCDEFDVIHANWRTICDARDPLKVKKDAIGLSLKLPGLPISASITNEGPSIDFNPPSIDTPIGSLGLKRVNYTGIKHLTIIMNGKKRFFKLDRPFNLCMPANEGFEMRSEGKEEMVIEIFAKPGDS